MAHRHIIGFAVILIGIAFLIIGATAYEHRILSVTEDSITIKVFDQDFNAPLVFLGISFIFIGVFMKMREKNGCHICNKKR